MEDETINWIQKIALVGSAIAGFIILISMNAFILIKEEGAMGVRTFLRQLIFSRRQLL